MEWTINAYDDNEVVVLSQGIRATIEVRYSQSGRSGQPVFYLATLGGAELGRFPTREGARQHLVTAGKVELYKAIRVLDELATGTLKQEWR